MSLPSTSWRPTPLAEATPADPSVPLTTMWFDHGVDLLAGTVVLDPAGALPAVQQGGRRSLFGDSLAVVELAAADVVHW